MFTEKSPKLRNTQIIFFQWPTDVGSKNFIKSSRINDMRSVTLTIVHKNFYSSFDGITKSNTTDMVGF